MRRAGEKMDGSVHGVLLHEKGRRDKGLVLPSHDRNGGGFRRMNGAGRGKSCRSEGGLLLLLLTAEKKTEGHGLELGEDMGLDTVSL